MRPTIPNPNANPLWVKYKLRCSHPGCPGTRIAEQAATAGLKVGDTVPDDPTDFEFGRCPRCRRTKMVVVEGPPPPKPQLPTGWNKIPDK